jgi:hypothetical protein
MITCARIKIEFHFMRFSFLYSGMRNSVHTRKISEFEVNVATSFVVNYISNQIKVMRLHADFSFQYDNLTAFVIVLSVHIKRHNKCIQHEWKDAYLEKSSSTASRTNI